MNKAFYLKKEERDPKWIVIDARGKVLGRLATQIADILRGKHTPMYTPHDDAGDYVVVINANDIVLTGTKMQTKEYHSYSGWMGGFKITTPEKLMAKHPHKVIELAVQRMLPKNRLSRQLIDKLKVYPDENHPHSAQVTHTAQRLEREAVQKAAKAA